MINFLAILLEFCHCFRTAAKAILMLVSRHLKRVQIICIACQIDPELIKYDIKSSVLNDKIFDVIFFVVETQ